MYDFLRGVLFVDADIGGHVGPTWFMMGSTREGRGGTPMLHQERCLLAVGSL